MAETRLAVQRIAEDNCIALAVAGSELYGTNLDDGDNDFMGVCVEPREYVIGLNQFEQWQHHSAGKGNRSGEGDIDLTIYSLRKWVRLAEQGNPTVLLLGFTPQRLILTNRAEHAELFARIQDNMHLFWSKQAAGRFLGYLESQKKQMLGLTGRRHSNRPELVELHGYDTKFAYHAVRLGFQGLEFMQTGRITLPMPEAERQQCLDIRTGHYLLSNVVNAIEALEKKLLIVKEESGIPDAPDRKKVNDLLVGIYQDYWNLT